jgi:hypothetical protein
MSAYAIIGSKPGISLNPEHNDMRYCFYYKGKERMNMMLFTKRNTANQPRNISKKAVKTMQLRKQDHHFDYEKWLIKKLKRTKGK